MEIELEVNSGIFPISRNYELTPSREMEERINSFIEDGEFNDQEVDSFLVDNESYILIIKERNFKKEYKIVEGLVSPDVLDLLDDIMNQS